MCVDIINDLHNLVSRGVPFMVRCEVSVTYSYLSKCFWFHPGDI
jgi:hypothetical protein